MKETFRFHHHGIETADLAGSIRFYRKVLGLKVEKRFRFENENCVFLKSAGIRIELCEVKSTRANKGRAAFSQNPTHLAMQVGNLDKWVRRLEKQNLKPDEGPFQWKNGIRTVFYRGPNGEILEFLEMS